MIFDLEEKKEFKLLDWEGPLPDLTNEEYHADKDRLSASLLMDFLLHGPRYYKRQLNPLTKIDLNSESSILGTYMHEANLEGKISKFVEMPEFLSKQERKKRGLDDSLSIEALKEQAELEFKKEKKQVVSSTTLVTIHSANHEFNQNKAVREIMTKCHVEKGYAFLHKETGQNCRFRSDLIDDEKDFWIYDYKTTSVPINPKKLSNHSVGLKYHLKAAHYLYGAERIYGRPFGYSWIFQSTKPPYSIAILDFKPSDIRKTMETYNKLMIAFQKQKDKSFKDDFTTIKTSLELPSYAHDLGWLES